MVQFLHFSSFLLVFFFVPRRYSISVAISTTVTHTHIHSNTAQHEEKKSIYNIKSYDSPRFIWSRIGYNASTMRKCRDSFATLVFTILFVVVIFFLISRHVFFKPLMCVCYKTEEKIFFYIPMAVLGKQNNMTIVCVRSVSVCVCVHFECSNCERKCL